MPKIIVYLQKSRKPGKKYMVLVDGKTVHFGASGMSDYTKHKDRERMSRYLARHGRGGETWSKSGLKTAGFWSRWLLWNKPTISGSKRNISSRFNVTFKSGWPTKSKPTMKYLQSKSHKTKSRSRKTKSRSRKSKSRSHKTKSRSRKTKSRSRKGKRRSRKTKSRSRKTKSRSRKGKSRSRKTKSRSRKGKSRSRKTKSRSRKGKSRSGKYENCVLKVKSKQPKHCIKKRK